MAACTTVAALLLVAGAGCAVDAPSVWSAVVVVVPLTPRALSAAASGSPFAGSPWADSNALIAARVCGPTTPSAGTPRRCCRAPTLGGPPGTGGGGGAPPPVHGVPP